MPICTLLVAPLVGAVLVADPPHPVRRIEVSEDGRTTVEPTDVTASPAAPAGAPAVLFSTTPDWQNDFRRQVGGLQVADLNGDGLLDVVVGCYQSNSFPPYDHWHNYIYYNVGGALEATPSWQSTDEVSTGDIQVGDVDGDGHLDIFSANGGFAMSPSRLYLGGPGGPDQVADWSSAEPGLAWNNQAILFDVDDDGDLDLVTANQGNSEFDPFRPTYLFRNVAGALETAPSWQSAESSIQNFLSFGDLDGDDVADLAVSKWVNWESGVYRNVAGTLATTPTWTTGEDGDDKGIGWADYDGDGDDDLAVGHDPTRIYRNDGGTLVLAWEATGTYFGHSELRWFDVDDDGDSDLAEIHFANGVANVYRNDGGVIGAVPAWTFNAPEVGTAIAFGDVSGDGIPDLVAGYSGNVSLRVFHGVAPPCEADLDGSGEVGFTDLVALLAAWGPCGGCEADLDGSGEVGFTDLVALLAAWGPC